MKKRYVFSVVFASLGLLLGMTGCRDAEREKTTNATENRQRANTNDPRWRNELFRSCVLSIRERATYENLATYLNSLNQATDRFNSWIQTQPNFEEWRADPMATETISALDALETLREPIQKTYQMLKNTEDETPLSPEMVAQLQTTAEALKSALESVQNMKSTAFQNLKIELDLTRKYLLGRIVLGKVSQELKSRTLALKKSFDRLGILIGSQRMEFWRTETSNIPTNVGEEFAISYDNDVYTLFEQFLLQDASQWAQGKPMTELEEVRLETRNESDTTGARNKIQVSVEDLNRMTSIFQWTVANIDLRDAKNSAPLLPLEVLLGGTGTVLERAWACILLARQQDLNAFLISVPMGDKTRNLLGFLHNEDVFLYDPELGMAVTKESAKDVPLRWAEACAEPALLENFWKKTGSFAESEILTLENLTASKAYLEASPWYITRRFAVLQEALKNGENRVVMSLSPVEVLEDGTLSEASLDAAFNAPSAIKRRLLRKNAFASVEIWDFPVENTIKRAFSSENQGQVLSQIVMPLCIYFPDGNFNLWRGRMLYLKGILTGPMSAAGYYQKARLSESDLEQFYLAAGPGTMDSYRYFRYEASYALGRISSALGCADAAIDSYTRHVIDAPFLTRRNGARYHAGRMCEEKGDVTEAIAFYNAVEGPMKPQATARKSSLAH